MPGFFDIIFGQSEPEPEAPKPKKVKKAKKPLRDPVKSLKAENKRLRTERDSLLVSKPEPEPEPEPEVEDEEPEPDAVDAE